MSSSEGSPPEGLPSSGPERVIFLRALQQFSDECEPPELQPLCPFSVDLADGGRGCAEECMDILAKYGDPQLQSGELTSGTGLSLSDDSGGNSAHGADLSRGVGPLMRKLRWCGTEIVTDPLPRGALFR
jgi:hypothetical protein